MWRDATWLHDMLQAARLAREYAAEVSAEEFLESVRHQDLVLRRLTILGEAAKQVSADTRAAHPAIPWRAISGLRDIVVHQYARVDLRRVWLIVEQEMPPLIAALEAIVPVDDE